VTDEVTTASTMTEPVAGHHEWVGRLDRELRELGERIGEFQERVKGTAEETRTRFRPLIDRLRANWHALGSAKDGLRTVAGEVSAAVKEELEQGRDRLKDELAAVRAELDIETAETKAAYREALRPRLDLWRSRIDELRVQVDLAEMEARDELTALVEDLEGAYRAARHHLDQADDHTADTLETLCPCGRQVLRNLHAAMDAAVNKLAEARRPG
jgi:gas vesicle protein